MPNPDRKFLNFNAVQSDGSLNIPTIASGETIYPQCKLTIISGIIPIKYIISPLNVYHEIVFLFLETYSEITFQTGGNIISSAVAYGNNTTAHFFYNPLDNKYYMLSYSLQV